MDRKASRSDLPDLICLYQGGVLKFLHMHQCLKGKVKLRTSMLTLEILPSESGPYHLKSVELTPESEHNL